MDRTVSQSAQLPLGGSGLKKTASRGLSRTRLQLQSILKCVQSLTSRKKKRWSALWQCTGLLSLPNLKLRQPNCWQPGRVAPASVSVTILIAPCWQETGPCTAVWKTLFLSPAKTVVSSAERSDHSRTGCRHVHDSNKRL